MPMGPETKRSHHMPATRFAMAVCALLLGLTTATAEYIVVTSGQSKAVEAAANAAVERLLDEGKAVQRVSADSVDDSVIALAGEDGFITIGAGATASISRSVPDTTPLYYTLVPQPTQMGLHNRSGASGISADVDIQTKLRIIRSVLPNATKVATLYRSGAQGSEQLIEAVSADLGDDWELTTYDIDSYKKPIEAVRAMVGSKPDVVLTLSDAAVYNAAIVKTLLLESLKQRVPVFGFSESLVRAGCLFGVGISPSEQGEAIAKLAIAQEAGIHVTPTPSTHLNLIVADRLGIEIPERISDAFDTVHD